MSIEEKIKNAKEDSWLKDSVSEEEFKKIKESVKTDGDCISRKAVLELYDKYHYSLATKVYEFGEELKKLPTIPQTDYESHESFGWCKGCKEYDTEKHCCHRYSSFIRESLQENINAVLEDIIAEIKVLQEGETQVYGKGSWNFVGKCLAIIDKHISRKE